jgi:hypothetical protein
MPTVPTTFVPQIAPQNAGTVGQVESPPVAVAENLAAQQQVRFGQTMLAAGTQAFRLGSAIQDDIDKEKKRVQDDIDEAHTKSVDIAFLQQATALMRGQNGYLRTSGQDAEAKYEETAQALASAAQTALNGLQNTTQRKMLEPVLARNMMTFQAQALDHRDQEVKRFMANESNARAQQYASLAVDEFENRGVPNSPFEVNRGVAIREVQQAAERMGVPQDSAQMRALEAKVNTEITVGVVNRLMESNRYEEAYEWIKAQREAKQLDRDTGDRLMASVDANRDRFLIDEYATTIKLYGRVGKTQDEENNAADKPQSLRSALQIAEGINDPAIRKGVEVALRSQYAQDEALAQREYNDAVDQIEQYLSVPGNTVFTIPVDIWGRLKLTDQSRLLSAQRKEDNITVLEELARNPELLTRQFVEEARHLLTRETYIKLLNDLNTPTTPDRVIAATIDADQLDVALINNGFPQLADPKTKADQVNSRALRNLVRHQIDQQQEAIKRPLTRTEKQAVADQAIMLFTEKVYEPDWIFDNEMMAGTMTPEQRKAAYVRVGSEKVRIADIPPSWIARVAIPGFKQEGKPNPTLKEIAELWIMERKPTQ